MASFTLQTTDAQARQFQFHAPSVTIGRDRGADFTLDHPTVSRQHAVVSWDGRQYKLVILSRGGLTAVDGQQVGGEVPLYDGAQLMFGQLQFVFRSQDSPARPTTEQPYTPPQYAPQQGAQQPVYSQHAFPTASTTGMHASADQTGLYQQSDNLPSLDKTAAFSSWSQSGSFPTPDVASQSQEAQPPPADGLVSWDQIAATADDVVEQGDSLTDFRRMQKAQEVADDQSKGLSPAVAIGTILVVGLVGLFFFYGGAEKVIGTAKVEQAVETDEPDIKWRKGDISCVGASDCREQAFDAFELGKQTLERQEADIVNLYEGFSQLKRADELLAKAAIAPRPPQMEGAEALQLRAAADMKVLFLTSRASFFAHEDRGDHGKMVGVLRKVQAYFPDDRLNYHRWVVKQTRQMKEDGVYPTQQIY